MRPTFLTIDDVLYVHTQMTARFGGHDGVRDLDLLESALAQPRQTFAGEYLHHDLAEMAAAHAFHIIRDHPFVDGNKRTGAIVALVFLERNGVRSDPAEDDYTDLILAVAEGSQAKDALSTFFRAVMPRGKPSTG